MSKEGKIWDMSVLGRSRGMCKDLKPERAHAGAMEGVCCGSKRLCEEMS